METIRTKLSRRRRKLALTMVLGFLILVAGMIGIILSQWFWVLIIGGGLIIMIPSVILWYNMPCPSCGGNLGHAINWIDWSSWKPNWKAGIPERIKFCQYCGVSLDKQIDP
jgi:hypothetical protein